MQDKIRVGITHGDINGVGYEVTLGALADETITELCTPVIFGYHALAEKARRLLGLDDQHLTKVMSAAEAQNGRISVVEISKEVPAQTPGAGNPESGKAAVLALECAIDALRQGDIDLLVTAPISKEAVQSEQFHFPGHTEYLEAKAGEGFKSRMILFDDSVRVALVTTHLPLSKVAEAITEKSVLDTIVSFNNSLRRDFGFPRPRIAVLSLNPHAGDGGVLGNEEAEQISPAIRIARENGIMAFGPFAADGFFGMGEYRKYDGIVAMYHDQGLAPFKTLAGERGVNFTAGLPWVRTSPDHGTAFNIAWKGEADPTSMREAIYKALDIFRRRARYDESAANPLRTASLEKGERGDRTRQNSKDRRQRPDADNVSEDVSDRKERDDADTESQQ